MRRWSSPSCPLWPMTPQAKRSRAGLYRIQCTQLRRVKAQKPRQAVDHVRAFVAGSDLRRRPPSRRTRTAPWSTIRIRYIMELVSDAWLAHSAGSMNSTSCAPDPTGIRPTMLRSLALSTTSSLGPTAARRDHRRSARGAAGRRRPAAALNRLAALKWALPQSSLQEHRHEEHRMCGIVPSSRPPVDEILIRAGWIIDRPALRAPSGVTPEPQAPGWPRPRRARRS